MTPPPGLRLTGTLRFGERVLFRDLDLRVPAGRWTCLLGPSGVGKSTILRLFAGLDVGEGFVGEVAASDGARLSGRVAWSGQADQLAPWLDVTDNVVLGFRLRGARPDMERARRLIAGVGLAEHAHKTPHMLSGGMRQRAALARLLMEDRPVALLDEPFAALDLKRRAEMQDLAFETLAGRTVLHVTHDPHETARLAHHVLLLTEAGLRELTPPPGPPPRGAGAAEVMAAQAELIRVLTEAELGAAAP